MNLPLGSSLTGIDWCMTLLFLMFFLQEGRHRGRLCRVQSLMRNFYEPVELPFSGNFTGKWRLINFHRTTISVQPRTASDLDQDVESKSTSTLPSRTVTLKVFSGRKPRGSILETISLSNCSDRLADRIPPPSALTSPLGAQRSSTDSSSLMD